MYVLGWEVVFFFEGSKMARFDFLVRLNNSNSPGFLIQARDATSEFERGSNIWGEWLPDPGSTPRYKLLECGRNSDTPEITFNVCKLF